MLGDNLALPASDLWALGCIIFRMHTGDLPFKAATENIVYDLILRRDMEFPPDLAPDAHDIIDKLL